MGATKRIEEGKAGGWAIRRSIALELDTALSAVLGYYDRGGLPEPVVAVVSSVPATWIEQWAGMFGMEHKRVVLLEGLGMLAGTLLDDNYDSATLAMRELTTEAAWVRLSEAAGPQGAEGELSFTPAERLSNAFVARFAALFSELGFAPAELERQALRLRGELEQGMRVLHGGDLHDRFWQWLDRFYYELYRPWRQKQAEIVTRLEQHATLLLGASEGVGRPPDLSWLPAQNPLLRYPELRGAVEDGRLKAVFWAEPFGLFDTWTALPTDAGDVVVVSYAEAGAIFDNFRAHVEALATRASALGDPTRLTILRMVRNLSMVNTEIAEYLGLSRPTVSVHARILREAGLIRSKQDGRLVRHEIAPAEVRRLFRDLERFLDLPAEEET